MEQIYEWLHNWTGIDPLIQGKLLKSVAVIVFLWIVSRLILRFVFRTSDDVMYRYRWSKSQGYIIFLIGLLIIGQIWIEEFKGVATVLGLLSAGLAIALKDPVTDLAGWLFILFRKPFEVGHRIQIGDHAGDVIDIRIFQFTIIEIGNWVDADQSTGRILHVPNSMLFRHTLANYHAGFNYIWHEMNVLVTFESNWKKAKSILKQIAENSSEKISNEMQSKIKKASKKYMIFYRNLTPIVYTDVKDSGVMLTMRFLCDPRQRRSYNERVWEAILDAFDAEKDIDFAYPTQRFFNNLKEGKPGTQPDSE
jgi:small-conductance mechanosensitive channel